MDCHVLASRMAWTLLLGYFSLVRSGGEKESFEQGSTSTAKGCLAEVTLCSGARQGALHEDSTADLQSRRDPATTVAR